MASKIASRRFIGEYPRWSLCFRTLFAVEMWHTSCLSEMFFSIEASVLASEVHIPRVCAVSTRIFCPFCRHRS